MHTNASRSHKSGSMPNITVRWDISELFARYKTIKVWNLKDDTCIQTFNGHTDQVYSLLLLKMTIWRVVPKTKPLQSGICHNARIWAIESTDTFDLSSDDESIKIWNLTSNECIRTLLGHTDGMFRIRIYSNEILASGSFDRSIQLWDLSSGQCTHTLDGHPDMDTLVECFEFIQTTC